MKTVLRRYHASFGCDALLSEWGGSLMSLALRLYLGWVFFQSGLTKLADWDSTLQLFTDEYQTPLLSPAVAAVMGTAGELSLPLLLFVGLLARPAALGLFMVNLMAVISYPQLWKFDCPAAINDHKFWGVLLLVLVVFGPGRCALDALLGKRRHAGAAATT
jgi:putative oxidoreductase